MHMNRTVWTLAFASLAVPMLSGCFFFNDWGSPDRGWSPTPVDRVPAPYNDGSLIVHSSWQVGDMGSVASFDTDAVASNATYYGTGASVRLDSIGSGWWVMSYLTIDNLDIVNAPPGTYRPASSEWTGSEPYVSVTGCSGPSYGNYTFDESTSDVEITLTDNADGTRTMDFVVRYRYYGSLQEASGSVVFSQGAYSPTYYDPRPIIATDVSQQGDMGSVVDYAAGADATQGAYYGNYASIRLDSVGSGWWVMSYLNVGNLDLANAPAGTYRSVVGVWEDDDPQLSVTGCSGPSYGNYTFDAPSDETEIVLHDNEDGTRTLELRAYYNFGGTRQLAEATFNFRVDATGTVRY